MPGGQSSLEPGKDLSWEPLRPELIVEVCYDHMQGDRFRHTAQFRRWRPDKKAKRLYIRQLEVIPPEELAAIFPQGKVSLTPFSSSSASATHVWDHRLGPAFPAAYVALRAHDAG